MNPGLRDKIIAIERPLSTPDAQGGRGKAWQTVCTAWGEFKRPRINTAVVQGGAAAVITQEIVVPVCDVRPGYRVVYGTKIYRVLGVSSDDRRYVTLVCEEVKHHEG
ncbi:MAG: head-tail adaptor protein [Synergistes sp.]|nr:head-tail adaptor protein [Synergistes sp.]